MTRFVSTRASGRPVSFRKALLGGLAPDGGLYVPQTIPALPDAARDRSTTFPELAAAVFDRWLGEEVDAQTQASLTADAFDFPVPLIGLDGPWDGVHVLELFHGPTLSFKDFGARMMARWMAHFLAETDERLTILVATSGDTGSAVADGFAGLDRIDVVLLYPKGQVSPVQERQLIIERPGVRAFAVDGTFDDCQRLVKAAFLDDELRPLNLSSANSINIGRLLPQMLYYLWAVGEVREAPIVCVPSGNLGNLTGGMLARLAGSPIHRFLAAHNANDFFPRFLEGTSPAFEPSKQTLSNAMDVGAPSNFERLEALLGADRLRELVEGYSVTDDETLRCMRRVADEAGYIACPHTAVGLEAVRRHRERFGDERPAIVLATAHPAKFPETVARATGNEPAQPERLAALWRRATSVDPLPPTLTAFRSALLAHAGS